MLLTRALWKIPKTFSHTIMLSNVRNQVKHLMVIHRNFLLRAAGCMRARFHSLNRPQKNSPQVVRVVRAVGKEKAPQVFWTGGAWCVAGLNNAEVFESTHSLAVTNNVISAGDLEHFAQQVGHSRHRRF